MFKMDKHNFLHKAELESLLFSKISTLDLHRVLSGYEMSENANQKNINIGGKPLFHHLSRVCGILIKELEMYDPDLLITSLLQGIFSCAEDISYEIIIYNFGPHVATLVDRISEKNMPDELKFPTIKPDNENIIEAVSSEDLLVILAANCLDDLRSLDFTPFANQLGSVLNKCEQLLIFLEPYQNPKIKYLIKEIKRERNKVLS